MKCFSLSEQKLLGLLLDYEPLTLGNVLAHSGQTRTKCYIVCDGRLSAVSSINGEALFHVRPGQWCFEAVLYKRVMYNETTLSVTSSGVALSLASDTFSNFLTHLVGDRSEYKHLSKSETSPVVIRNQFPMFRSFPDYAMDLGMSFGFWVSLFS